MHAIVLCGGFAKRMWPLTKDKPKSLLPIQGKPLLYTVLKKIEPLEQIKNIYISANAAFEDQFSQFLRTYQSRKFIKLVIEPTRSEEQKFGAVKGLEWVIDQEKITEPVLIVNGDNLFDASLFGIMLSYREHRSPIVGVYDVQDKERAKRFGIVQLDQDSKIVGFQEKPAEPISTLASTGVYVLTVPVLERLGPYLKNHPGDRVGDFIAWLIQELPVYGYPFQGLWLDIGSVEEYERAQTEWKG